MTDGTLSKDIVIKAKELLRDNPPPDRLSKIAGELRKYLESSKGITWNVFVGKGGLVSAVVFEENKFINFKVGEYDVIAFKTFESVKAPEKKTTTKTTTTTTTTRQPASRSTAPTRTTTTKTTTTTKATTAGRK